MYPTASLIALKPRFIIAISAQNAPANKAVRPANIAPPLSPERPMALPTFVPTPMNVAMKPPIATRSAEATLQSISFVIATMSLRSLNIDLKALNVPHPTRAVPPTIVAISAHPLKSEDRPLENFPILPDALVTVSTASSDFLASSPTASVLSQPIMPPAFLILRMDWMPLKPPAPKRAIICLEPLSIPPMIVRKFPRMFPLIIHLPMPERSLPPNISANDFKRFATSSIP